MRIGLAVIFAGVCALTAGAADRVVLWEDFTATWCSPCQLMAGYIDELETNFPDTTFCVQEHINSSDPYWTNWGHARFIAYGNYTYIPDVWTDGNIQTTIATSYEDVLNKYNQERAIPTDVTVLLGAVQTDPNNPAVYNVTARLTLDANGTAKTVRLAMLRMLDHFPNLGPQNRNCLVGGGTGYAGPSDQYEVNVDLVPGQTVDVARSFTFDALSMTTPENMRLAAWAQKPVSQTPWGTTRPVYNAKKISYPFAALPPIGLRGDMNCDGRVDFGDINPFISILNGATPCSTYNADVNGDGRVDFGDINPFIALLNPPG